MAKIQQISEIAQSLPFSEFDFYDLYRRTFAWTELGRMNRLLPLHEMTLSFGLVRKSRYGAFERRFLYKIKFEKPTLEARMNMWHEMIPTLKEEGSRALASKYVFSGGQIENIARHYTIGKILHGEPANVAEEISSYCDNERLETKEKRRIGFNG